MARPKGFEPLTPRFVASLAVVTATSLHVTGCNDSNDLADFRLPARSRLFTPVTAFLRPTCARKLGAGLITRLALLRCSRYNQPEPRTPDREEAIVSSYVIPAALSLGMVITPAWAQSTSTPALSRDETFKQIGRSLEGIGSSLNSTSQSAGSVGAAPAVQSGGSNAVLSWNDLNAAGSTLTAGATVTGLAGPNPTANAAATLAPGTRVQVQGLENGFVKIAPLEGPATGRSVWVPQGTAQATFISGYVDARIGEAMEKISQLAAAIENNPYVRLKGFKLNVSISPSLDVEFEMKGGESAPASAASIPKPTEQR